MCDTFFIPPGFFVRNRFPQFTQLLPQSLTIYPQFRFIYRVVILPLSGSNSPPMRKFPIAVPLLLFLPSFRLSAQKTKEALFDLATPGGATTLAIKTGHGGTKWSV